MKVRLSLTGTAPLIVHNIRLANPLDPITREVKVISGKRKKTDDDLMQLARLEFEGGLYMSDVIGPYIPGANVEKCIVEGGRITKQGKQIERGLFVIDNEIPLVYRGPRDVEGMWADEDFRLVQTVRVPPRTGSRVQRCRPIFRQWALDAEAEVDPGLLNLDTLASIATDAGSMCGLGDYRPRYGRFAVEVTAL